MVGAFFVCYPYVVREKRGFVNFFGGFYENFSNTYFKYELSKIENLARWKIFFWNGDYISVINNIESLNKFISLIPIIKCSIPADLSIAICDLERFVAYFPGDTINLNISEGQLLNKEEPLYLAMRENQALKSDVPANFYGFEFTGTATPLHDQNGQVIGGIAVQIRRQSELKAIVEQISESLTQANEQINNISYGSNSLADYSQQLLIQSQQAGRVRGEYYRGPIDY